jgi:hypothetical protein
MCGLMRHEAEKQCGTSVAPLGKNSLRHCVGEVKMEDGNSTIHAYRVGKE